MLKIIWLFLLVVQIWTISTTPSYAHSERAKISWYHEGKFTANGEHYNKMGLTCAHRTLPFNTIVKVEYNGKVVSCRINDRGPALWTHRDLDLSQGAASVIGMIDAGVVYADLSWPG
jgi:rare lipoprotein A